MRIQFIDAKIVEKFKINDELYVNKNTSFNKLTESQFELIVDSF